MSFENWLNLWKYKHYFLHSVCACFCIFCCCCCLFIFPFFGVVGFPFHPQFFFADAPSSFFAFYTLDFVTYMFETSFTEISLPSIRNGTYVMYGTYIEPTLLHFCLVACYFVENSEFAGWKTALKCGLFWAPSTWIRRKKNGVSKMSRFVWTWPLGPVNKEGG